MWINPSTQTVYRTHSAVRASNRDVSFPADMNDGALESVGLVPVQQVAAPSYNRSTHSIAEATPVLVDGVWTQQWALTALQTESAAAALAERRADRWEQIKSIRDSKTQNGGYLVDGKWFHSDIFSRIQQIGLTIMGNGVPPGLQWKTMDGSFVGMNPAKASGVFAAAAAQDLALFTRAEQLKAAVDAAADPDSVDIDAGWPAVYVPSP